ncbi:MAG TPA: tyrosine-type recombinase/integrase [Terriglobia bacterium]|nr:tyrosine-type recombinase/integrase [Terriglobia bacterium]
MRRTEGRIGQIGDYWLSKKPRKDREDNQWCRTWYDPGKRQTCRVSLRTADFREASQRLAAWVLVHERSHLAAPAEILIDAVLLHYWNDHAQYLASATTQKLGLSYWHEFWTKRSVAALTPHEQRRFREWLAGRGTGASGIDRILSVGRAALNRALKWQEIASVPHIFGTLTAEAKRAREPMGRPASPKDISQLLESCRSRHMLMFILIAANTLARPAAILDLTPEQFDDAHGLVDLNPPVRVQNKKFRPILPVTPSLAPWLRKMSQAGTPFVTCRGKPITSISYTWRLTRQAAGLDNKITPYSIRHGMAREMRKRRVPTEQISLFLGHLPSGSNATTSIYAPYEPAFLSDAVSAIEEVMMEIQSHLTGIRLDQPMASLTDMTVLPKQQLPRAASLEGLKKLVGPEALGPQTTPL